MKNELELIAKFDWLRQEVRHGYNRLVYLSRQAQELVDFLDERYYALCTELAKLNDDDGGITVSAKEKLNVLSRESGCITAFKGEQSK